MMAEEKSYRQGWIIVGWAALALAAMVAIILAIYGAGEEGVKVVIRATARTSFTLFLAAFSATALLRLWPGNFTKWLRANRRYVGVSFGVSHALHAAAIVSLAGLTDGASLGETDMPALIGGGLGYLFIAAMVATSFDRTTAWLGPRRWKLVHSVGMYLLWGIFFFSYGSRAAFSAYYAPLALLLISALALRVIATRRGQRFAAAKGA